MANYRKYRKKYKKNGWLSDFSIPNFSSFFSSSNKKRKNKYKKVDTDYLCALIDDNLENDKKMIEKNNKRYLKNQKKVEKNIYTKSYLKECEEKNTIPF